MDVRDILTDDVADEAVYRESATALLDEIAHQARVALQKAGIRLNVFFVVPRAGDAILTLGPTVSRDEWQDIQAVIGSIVRRSIGLEPSRCREIICAMAKQDDAAP